MKLSVTVSEATDEGLQAFSCTSLKSISWSWCNFSAN